RYIGADSGAALHGDALVELEALLGPAKEIVVGEGSFGSDEAAVLNFREGGDVRFRFQLAAAAHAHLVFDGDAAADDGELAHFHVLPQGGHVRDHHFPANDTAAINHDHRPDHAIIFDDAGIQHLVLRDRTQGRLHRQLADNRVVINPDVVADGAARMDDHPAADFAVAPDAGVFVNDAVKP